MSTTITGTEAERLSDERLAYLNKWATTYYAAPGQPITPVGSYPTDEEIYRIIRELSALRAADPSHALMGVTDATGIFAQMLSALKEAQVCIDADAEVEAYGRISAAIFHAEAALSRRAADPSPAPVGVTDEAVLPCDVSLPPATTIRAGCKLSTLVQALRVRGMAEPLRPAVEQAGGEVVAWRWTAHNASGHVLPWEYSNVRPSWLETDGFVVQPLYASPQPPATTPSAKVYVTVDYLGCAYESEDAELVHRVAQSNLNQAVAATQSAVVSEMEARNNALDGAACEIRRHRELLNSQYEVLDIGREDAIYGICEAAVLKLKGEVR